MLALIRMLSFIGSRKTTHQYGAQDPGGEAYDEPFDPRAVTERGGIQDLRGTMAGYHIVPFARKHADRD